MPAKCLRNCSCDAGDWTFGLGLGGAIVTIFIWTAAITVTCIFSPSQQCPAMPELSTGENTICRLTNNMDRITVEKSSPAKSYLTTVEPRLLHNFYFRNETTTDKLSIWHNHYTSYRMLQDSYVEYEIVGLDDTIGFLILNSDQYDCYKRDCDSQTYTYWPDSTSMHHGFFRVPYPDAWWFVVHNPHLTSTQFYASYHVNYTGYDLTDYKPSCGATLNQCSFSELNGKNMLITAMPVSPIFASVDVEVKRKYSDGLRLALPLVLWLCPLPFWFAYLLWCLRKVIYHCFVS